MNNTIENDLFTEQTGQSIGAEFKHGNAIYKIYSFNEVMEWIPLLHNWNKPQSAPYLAEFFLGESMSPFKLEKK